MEIPQALVTKNTIIHIFGDDMILKLINHNEEYAVREITASFFPKTKFEYSDNTEDGDYVESEYLFSESKHIYKASAKIGELYKEYEFSAKEYNKTHIKRCVASVLEELTGIHLPWGVLTGIRPSKIVRELKIIAKEEGRYFTVNNTAELDRQFKSIAKSLIDSWKVLSCFISAGQNGKVCWTFGKKYVQPVVEKSDVPLLLGLNGGLGIPMEFGECLGAGLDFHLGFDFAYPLTDRFALGAYLSVGGGFTAGEYYSYYSNYYDYYFGGVFKFSAGLLMEFGDLNDRPFMLGISPCAGFEFTYGTYTVPIELRFGRVLANDWYMMGELVMGFGYGTYLEPAIRVGYNFGNNVYPRKKR